MHILYQQSQIVESTGIYAIIYAMMNLGTDIDIVII